MTVLLVALIPEVVIKVGPVRGRVAAGAEAASLRQAASMILFSDHREIYLDVAAQT